MTASVPTAALRQCLRQCHRHSLRPRHARHQKFRAFGNSQRLDVVKPFLLADIGEGITECQIIQWFVQPGARVEQFDKICEVQSDKASVEITSRFDGIIKKLHYEKDDVARVGKPLLDIDIQSDISAEDEAVTTPPAEQQQEGDKEAEPWSEAHAKRAGPKEPQDRAPARADAANPSPQDASRGRAAKLATPAVRRITRELGVAIADVQGSGRDGRVLKEDVQKFASAQQSQEAEAPGPPPAPSAGAEDKVVKFTAMQSAMYKTMTRSLSIPHLLYTDTVELTNLDRLRKRINKRNADDALPEDQGQQLHKISALAFIVKAISFAFQRHPHLNAHLDASTETPTFTLKAAHHIGIAVDSPAGLTVPVIRNVQSHTIYSLAGEIRRLSSLAQAGKLTSQDLHGATFTVSNVGSIGGTVVAPVIVSPQVAIVGVGKTRTVPGFAEDGTVIKREECVFSWSADHRVLDGATVARAAEAVRKSLENIEDLLVGLR